MADTGDRAAPAGASARELAAEALGTGLLLSTIVGSGIMAEALSDGSVGLALLANSLATGAILAVSIAALGPVSGAHFNPAVTLAFLLRRETPMPKALAFAAAQIVGGVLGVVTAHLMFGLEPLALGDHARSGAGQWLGEGVATFALVFTILACLRHRLDMVPIAVGLVIVAGHWATSSTSFANPAVTVARTLTDTFTAIRPGDAPAFIAAQLAAAALATGMARWLFADAPRAPHTAGSMRRDKSRAAMTKPRSSSAASRHSEK